MLRKLSDATFPPSKKQKLNGNYTFLFHGNCIDGWFSAFIARKAINDVSVNMYPISPSQTNTWPSIEQMKDTHILLLDVSVPKEYRDQWLKGGALSVDCIDHHVTSIQHWPENCPINTESCAALQTWRRYFPDADVPFWLHSIDRIDRWDNPTEDDRCIRELLNTISHKPVQNKMSEAFSMTDQFIRNMGNDTGMSAIIGQGKSLLIPKDEELLKILGHVKDQPNRNIYEFNMNYIRGWNLPMSWLNLKVFIIDNTGITLDTTGAAHLAFTNYGIDVFINYRRNNKYFPAQYIYSARSRGFDITNGTILRGHPTSAGATLSVGNYGLPFLLA